MTFRIITLFIGLALSASATVFSANTDTQTESYMNGVIHIYGNEVRFPMTAWQEEALDRHHKHKRKKHLEAFQTYTNEEDGIFIFEQMPNEDSFDNWSKLYSILGMDHAKEKPINVYMISNANHKIFKESCLDYRYVEEAASESPHETTLITLFCEQIKGTQEGEIMVKHISVTQDNQSIEIYHEWKGPAFDHRKPSTWPASPEDINDIKQRFNHISILNTSQME